MYVCNIIRKFVLQSNVIKTYVFVEAESISLKFGTKISSIYIVDPGLLNCKRFYML